jgi:hypothetical protein
VGLSLAVLAAFAVDRLASDRKRRPLLAVVIAATLIQLLPAQITTWRANTAPPWDRWLATQPRGIVANYPMETDAGKKPTPAFKLAASELNYQRITGNPLYALWGTSWTLTREGAIRLYTRYVTDPGTPGMLRSEHVRYVVVHDDVYRAEHQPPPTLASPFRLLKTFGPVRVFELTDAAAPVDVDATLEQNAASLALVYGLKPPRLSYRAGFGPPTESGGSTWRRFGTAAKLELRNDDPRERRVQAIIRVRNDGDQTVLAFNGAGGAALGQTVVPHGEPQVTIGPFPLSIGTTTITLSTASGRSLSIAVDPLIQPLADYSATTQAAP